MPTNAQPRTSPALAVAFAILETVAEMGDRGAPSGPMYAALMGKLSLDQYQQITGALVRAGLVTEANHCYYITPLATAKLAEAKAKTGLQTHPASMVKVA